MSKFFPQVGYLKLILLLALYFTFVVNLPILWHFYRILTALPAYKLSFAISIPLVLFSALSFVFMLFSFKLLLKPFFIVVLPISALASYAMLKYQVIFDRSMIENIVETQQAEASSYLNISVILWFIFTGLLPALLLWTTKITYSKTALRRLGSRLTSMAISLVIIITAAGLFYKDYASVGRSNRSLNLEIVPTNYLYSSFQYVNHRFFTKKIPFQKIAEDAKLQQANGQKPTLIFLVIGETARAQNQSFNGYARPTNSFTQNQSNVLYFSNVSSCGTATAVSVPCMFSNMTRSNFDNNRARSSEGLLDVLQKAGISVWWKDNDEGCKGVCDRVPYMIADTKKDGEFCDGTTCYDQVLLKNLEQEITDDNKSKLVALHLIGSHGPTYYRRYPPDFSFFMPDCQRSDIENCTQEQLINTYDNTVRYTDFVVSSLIDKAKTYENKYNVALIYISDHGESLGEKGLYLHGTPYSLAPAQQTQVPMLFWLSPEYTQAKNIDMRCLQTNAANNDYSQDNLFHTVLDAMNVSTREKEPQLDILQPCKTATE